MKQEADGTSPDRVPTGVPGFDTILLGGLLRSGVYIIQGRPGGGKTILANQICYHHAAKGGQVIYTTLLAETHERLLQYMARLEFFDVARIPDQVSYLSAFSRLQEGGLKGIAEMLRQEARSKKATLVVLDGLVTAEEHAESNKDFKQFIQELQVHASLIGYTVLLLTSVNGEPTRPEHTMVDGVIAISDNRQGRTSEREIEIKKFRGSGYLRGAHAFEISSAGISIYPRIEAAYQNPGLREAPSAGRISTGVPSLDDALHGGLMHASSTVLFGPTGSGKTSLGLHFLNECSSSEPGLLFSFFEPASRALLKGKALGLDLEAKNRSGILDMQWFAPTERILDALGHRILDTVKRRGVKRLFVDGVEGFLKAAEPPERISHFLSALTNELRLKGVTAIYTSELSALFSKDVALPVEGISSLVENVLLLRFIEHQSEIRRTLSIIKTRDSSYDPTVREWVISERGTRLGSARGHAATTLNGSQGRVKRLVQLLKKRDDGP